MKGIFASVLSLLAVISMSAGNQVVSSYALSEVQGDGVKITTINLHYGEPIDGSSLSVGSYRVAGREIGSVTADPNGDVLIKLNSTVSLVKTNNSPQAPKPGQGPKARLSNGGVKAGQKSGGKLNVVDTALVTQVLPVKTAGGSVVAASESPIVVHSVRTLVADDFKQFSYVDPATGITLRYNLYIPENYDTSRKYPLVLFMHDASCVGGDVKTPLLQGNGATVWATPEWQTQHPCFVLAPEFDEVTVDDEFTVMPDLDALLNLIDSMKVQYSLDANRIYTTGQSMGCMSSYVLMLKRPDLFASAMLVAGQWDSTQVAPLAKKNLWLLSCNGDEKSTAGVAAAVKVWTAGGATVREREWPLYTTAQARKAEVNDMLRLGGNIHVTHFTGGSHMITWRVAYGIEGVREWLFAQHRPLGADSLLSELRDTAFSHVMVAAYHGDYHGNTASSIMSLEKAVMKGAHMALVDVKLRDDTLLLGSGERLDAALDSVGSDLLLIANVPDAATARALEQQAVAHDRQNQLILYGSNYDTSLNYVARVDVDKDYASLDEVLSQRPVAVELDFSNSDNPNLAAAVKKVNAVSKVLVNTTSPGLCGGFDEDMGRNAQLPQRFDPIVDLGARVILSGQIKPLLIELGGLD